MPKTTPLLLLSVAALACASCGSTAKTKTKPHEFEASKASVYPASYHASLSGSFPGGKKDGSASVVVSVVPSATAATTYELCWQFSNMKNVQNPTDARLYRIVPGLSGAHGYKLGPTFTPSGCLKLNHVLFAVLEHNSQEFGVSIHTVQYPKGAVRGPA